MKLHSAMVGPLCQFMIIDALRIEHKRALADNEAISARAAAEMQQARKEWEHKRSALESKVGCRACQPVADWAPTMSLPCLDFDV
eukprot:scaffold252001_cov25-Prasinocladus_malaysianus.AAC.1